MKQVLQNMISMLLIERASYASHKRSFRLTSYLDLLTTLKSQAVHCPSQSQVAD